MTWTRLSDDWCENQVFEDLSYAARWHYVCLLQFCSRSHRYDGVIKRRFAIGQSDVDAPEAALKELVAAGLLTIEEGSYRVVNIDQHVLPPSMRDENRKASQNKRQAKGDCCTSR